MYKLVLNFNLVDSFLVFNYFEQITFEKKIYEKLQIYAEFSMGPLDHKSYDFKHYFYDIIY